MWEAGEHERKEGLTEERSPGGEIKGVKDRVKCL